MESYPTTTDIVVITDAPNKLAAWRDTNTVARLRFRVHSAANLDNPLRLAWVHRSVAQEAIAAGEPYKPTSSRGSLFSGP